MASGGVSSPTDPIANTQYSEAEIRAIVDEAAAANTYVMAHAYTARAIRRAIECGVRTIEHGNLVEADTARLMAEKGAFAVPTQVTYEMLAEYGERLLTRWRRSRTCARPDVTPCCCSPKRACRWVTAPTCWAKCTNTRPMS